MLILVPTGLNKLPVTEMVAVRMLGFVETSIRFFVLTKLPDIEYVPF